MNECATCKRPANQRCSRCKIVYYCNQQCQRNHWKKHKKQCRGGAQPIKHIDDRRNMQEFDQLCIKLDPHSPSDHHIDSSHLFIPYNYRTNVGTNCNLTHCQSFKYIIALLEIYHNYLQRSTEQHRISSIDHLFDSGHSRVHLLNAFNHLLMEHEQQFEEIYSGLRNSHLCELCDCVSMRRNQRDRHKMSDNHQLKDLYFNDNIITQQILDKIHSYYYHTFDIGYKCTESDQNAIFQMQTETKINDENNNGICFDVNVAGLNEVMASKNVNRQMFERLRRVNHKFNAISQNFMRNTSNMNCYSFGKRFFYWSHYKTSKNDVDPAQNRYVNQPTANVNREGSFSILQHWFICNKWENFKEELLLNKICTLNLFQWKQLSEKAKLYIQTDMVRSIICGRNKTALYYDIEYRASITEDHIIAMMVYCNFDLLQTKFTETFRYKDKHETDNELKERHSHYHYFGRLLRECVECFGTDIANFRSDSTTIRLYHGIDQTVSFTSLNAFIKGPFSTTPEYAVAQSFCGKSGILLGLSLNLDEWRYEYDGGNDPWMRVSCFRCNWLSDYVAENEIFFIGGSNKFTFDTLIEAQTCINYCECIKGLRQLTYCMSNSDTTQCDDVPKTKNEKQMVFRMIAYRLFKCYPDHKYAHDFEECTEYFQNIINQHCDNITYIRFMNRSKKEESVMHETLFKYDNEWVKINLLCRLFPNLEYINYSAEDKDITFLKQSIIYDSVLNIVESGNTKFEQIDINMNEEFASEMKHFIHSKYEKRFKKYSWKVYVKVQNLYPDEELNIVKVKKLYPEEFDIDPDEKRVTLVLKKQYQEWYPIYHQN